MSTLELTILEKDELEWQDEGLCAQTDPEAFFPDNGEDLGVAKKVCRKCPVRDKCLEFALDTNDQWGIWGGLNLDERLKFKRREIEPTKQNIDHEIDTFLSKRGKRYKDQARKYL